MIQIWSLTPQNVQALQFNDMTSLDAITRQLPEGYYTTFRTFHGCTWVLGLKTHLRRLYGPVPHAELDAAALRRDLLQLLGPFRPAEARVRLMMTEQGQVYVAAEPLKPWPRAVYEKGVRVETTEIQRHRPRLKSTAFISASTDERKHILQIGIFEALLVRNGKILEGMTSNFFYTLRPKRSVGRVQSQGAPGAIIYTAQRNILLGVTRTMVIRAARSRGVEVKYQPLEVSQLSALKEAFITSSSRGIVPVIQIDEVKVGQGRVGPLTRELIAAYEGEVLKKAEKI